MVRIIIMIAIGFYFGLYVGSCVGEHKANIQHIKTMKDAVESGEEFQSHLNVEFCLMDRN